MFVENFAPFFQDFGITCTVAGVQKRAIFDNGLRLGSAGLAGVASTGPTLTIPTSELSADPVGQAVVANSVNYLVAAHEPDGTGLSLLLLERA